MRILGIDPGLATTGVGVIEQIDGGWRLVDSGDVRTASSSPMPERLKRIHETVRCAIETHAPDAVAIESVFTARNIRSAILMAHGRGAAILAASGAGVRVFEYTPAEIKQSVVGSGRADKTQVMQMVKTLLAMPALPPNDHQADALACALAHAYRNGLAARIAAASSGGSATVGLNEAQQLLAKARRPRRRR